MHIDLEKNFQILIRSNPYEIFIDLLQKLSLKFITQINNLTPFFFTIKDPIKGLNLNLISAIMIFQEKSKLLIHFFKD